LKGMPERRTGSFKTALRGARLAGERTLPGVRGGTPRLDLEQIARAIV
jgi:hypothetical protein